MKIEKLGTSLVLKNENNTFYRAILNANIVDITKDGAVSISTQTENGNINVLIVPSEVTSAFGAAFKGSADDLALLIAKNF